MSRMYTRSDMLWLKCETVVHFMQYGEECVNYSRLTPWCVQCVYCKHATSVTCNPCFGFLTFSFSTVNLHINPKRVMEGAIGRWSLLERPRIWIDSPKTSKTSQPCDIVKTGVHLHMGKEILEPESKTLEAKEPSKDIKPSRNIPKRHWDRTTSNIRIKSCNDAEPNLSNVC